MMNTKIGEISRPIYHNRFWNNFCVLKQSFQNTEDIYENSHELTVMKICLLF
jgi:hypothetical protein